MSNNNSAFATSKDTFSSFQKVLGQSYQYEQYLRAEYSQANPIIVIPGVLGSRLVNEDQSFSLWGDFRRTGNNVSSKEKQLQIALPMAAGKTLDELVATSKADGSVRKAKVSIVGVPVDVNVYSSLMEAMGVAGQESGHKTKKLDDYVDDNRHLKNAFEFSYDWRRSIDENAIELGVFIQQVSRFLKLHRGNKNPIKFDIVAHSMGGLIARYYLRYGQQLLPADSSSPVLNYNGTANIENVIIIGTPNAGSLFALDRLIVGLPKTAATPGYDPLILGTMPSVYQLLPRIRHKTLVRCDQKTRHTDFLHLDFWLEMSWGLADKKRDNFLAALLAGIDSPVKRYETALEHLEKCLTITRAFQQAMDREVIMPEHVKMFLFVGDSISTPLIASIKKGDKKLTIQRKGAGDGTVPRASALLDERLSGITAAKVVSPLKWDNIMFLNSNHLGLTKDALCIKNILYLLLERP